MEVAIWSVVLTGVYATTLAVATLPEVLVAVGAAVCCAVLAVAAPPGGR
jgi:hypothetical protein